MRKIVVTGATSFIALPLIKKLLDYGDFIYAIIRPESKNKYKLPKHNNIKIIEIDLKNFEYLYKYISEDINIFYHFAWEGIRGDQQNYCELQKDNYLASMKLIKVAYKLNVSLFIGTGSQAEYGNIVGPISEDMKESPCTEYGKYKLKAKKDCEAYASNKNIKFIWLRIFSAYGENDYKNTLIMSCIEKMKKNQQIMLTECTQKWNYFYVGDIANVLFMFSIVRCDSGVYNIASEHTRILKEYILELKDILNSQSSLVFGSIPYNIHGPINIEPKVSKVKHTLQWWEETTFENGIRNLINWMDTSVID